MYNFKGLTAALVLSVAATTAQAVEVSGEVGYVSDYVFRGISQNDEDGALQGGVNFDFDSGWYAGIWASDVDMGEEVDFFGGYVSEANVYGAGLKYLIGVTQYTYTDDDFAEDYTEFNGIIETTLGQHKTKEARKYRGRLGVAVNYSPEIFQVWDEDVEYVNAVVYYITPETKRGWSAHAKYGYSNFDADIASIYVSDSWSYNDWNIGVNKMWEVSHGEVVVSVDYYDTDMDEGFGSELTDDRVVGGIKYKF